MSIGGPTLGRAGSSEPVLVWRFESPRLVLSSASVGGGLGIRHWVINAEVDKDYARTDLAEHIAELAADLGLVGDGVGLLTAARVGRFATAAEDGASVVATVGVSTPTWASAPPTSATTDVGTINIVADVPVRCAPEMMVNLVMTITEAKSQALLAGGVDGTGTASDAVVIMCPVAGTEERFGGPRSYWGQRIARIVHQAVESRVGGGS